VVWAALMAVTVAALVHVSHRSSGAVRATTGSTAATAATAATVASPVAVVAPAVVAAASWAALELSRDATIVADSATRATLAANRFTHVQTPAATLPGTALTFDYIVSTAALRAVAVPGSPIDRALNSSLPIAVFGSGSDQVVVRQVSTAPSAEVAARRSTDLETRRSAERQLLSNPAIRVSGPARAQLQAGQLDLRAATVIALMANSSHVEILSVNVDEPERAAGLPARSVDVRTDAAAGVQVMPSNLPPLYKPIADTLSPNGTHRLVWSISPEAPAALN
jgi:hypothetical protein